MWNEQGRTLLAWTVILPAAAVATTTYASDYLSVAQAQKLMFPAANAFVAQPITLTPAQQQTFEAATLLDDLPVTLKVFQARRDQAVLGYFVLDAAVGKFELMDFAVALSPDGSIRQVEVLSYRESHGYEVRNAAWRQQFVGKSAQAPLRLGQDIQGISGATLSCTHLSDGIRRVALLVRLLGSKP